MSPKDSMTAAGRRSSAASSAPGRLSSAQVMKPMPTARLPALSNSAEIQSSEPQPSAGSA